MWKSKLLSVSVKIILNWKFDQIIIDFYVITKIRVDRTRDFEFDKPKTEV